MKLNFPLWENIALVVDLTAMAVSILLLIDTWFYMRH